MFKGLRAVITLILLFGMFSIAEAAPQWQATIWIASGGGNPRLVLGGDDTATDGFDNVWDSYAMLGSQLRPYFYRPDWHPVFKTYWRDIRANAPGKTTEWPFVIESDMVNKDVTLTWDLSLLPGNYAISLIDDTNGQTIDMSSTPSYSFIYTGKRNFRVAVYAPPDIPPNRPPVANAGPDQIVECILSGEAIVTLDGSLSSDPDNDPLTYTWTGTFGTATGMNSDVKIPLGTDTITLTVDDGKGGRSTDTVLITVQDTRPPSTTATITGTEGNNNWYISGVAIGFIASDSCSGVKAINYSINGSNSNVSGDRASISLTTDGRYTVSYFAEDSAGNRESEKSMNISIDKTPPSLTAVASPTANPAGWHNSDVTVSFTCSDATSGIASCPSPLAVTAEGRQVITGGAIDNAGNTQAISLTLNIDKTVPAVNVSATPNILWPPNKKMVNVKIDGSAQDATSGIASVNITVTDEYGVYNMTVPNFGSTIQLEAWRRGDDMDGRRYTIEAIAIDVAGNRSAATTQVVVPHDIRGGK